MEDSGFRFVTPLLKPFSRLDRELVDRTPVVGQFATPLLIPFPHLDRRSVDRTTVPGRLSLLIQSSLLSLQQKCLLDV
ncbi:unnamed protein product [Ectocarpus sp. CCAP 1310/34]|nr:unnamed protein product [Ectocarpus sp. CCAP 1310/34]